MHAASSALLVQRTPSYPTSDLIRCISPCDSHSCSSDYAIVSLSGMPSLPCRLPCLQRLSASIPPRRSRVSTPQRPEAGPGAAVSLSPCAPESQPGELRKGRLGSGDPQLQRSRSAPLHDGWRSHVWLLNITPYVPRHKHQSTTPLSLPYLQLVEIVDTPLDPCTILPTRKWISARFRHIHLDLGVHITALAGISRCIAGDMRQDMLPSFCSEPKPSEQWNRLPERNVLNRNRGR